MAAIAATRQALEVSMPGLALTTKLEHSGWESGVPGLKAFPGFFQGVCDEGVDRCSARGVRDAKYLLPCTPVCFPVLLSLIPS